MTSCRHLWEEWGHYPAPSEPGYVIWWARCPSCGSYQYERRREGDPNRSRPALPSMLRLDTGRPWS